MQKFELKFKTTMNFKWSTRLLLPCMGLFLQGAVKALAVVEIGVQFTMIVIATVDYATTFKTVTDKVDDETAEFCAHMVTWTYCYSYKAVCIILGIRLFIVASRRNQRSLFRWLIISIILYILWMACFITNTVLGFWSHALSLTAYIGLAVYKLYSFYIVVCFIREIKQNGKTDQALRILSDAELDEFFNGNKSTGCKHPFLTKAYQKDFEIPLAKLNIDTTIPLGAGAFGVVFKANLVKDNPDVRCQYGLQTLNQIVAVKTVPPTVDIAYFKALLRELQILNYIGTHENIVNLIGACTSEVNQRKLYVIVEFCAYGSLQSYLQNNRHKLEFGSKPHVDIILQDYEFNIGPALSPSDLVKWSMQTASGMEYIAHKNVIHGDLAARNVLLTLDGTAKIADFGLSRQLYRYTTYTKNTNEPLPWRWMSVESICDLKFSSSSDVWSFGITVWEYFSGGQIPYPGIQFDSEFVSQLKTGLLKPHQPQFSTCQINEQMLELGSKTKAYIYRTQNLLSTTAKMSSETNMSEYRYNLTNASEDDNYA